MDRQRGYPVDERISMATQIVTTGSDQDFVTQAVAWMEQKIVGAIADKGHAIIGLSGGSTPRPVYGALGEAKSIEWDRVWMFLVDDRYCREDSPHSNQFLLRSSLLRSAPVPESQLLFPDTDLPVDECIAQYDAVIGDMLKKGGPDLVTLGLGDDGHIASLFPPVPEAAFGPKNAIHTTTEKFDIKDRISVTMPVIAQAGAHLLLLKGAAKRDTWDAMMKAEDDPRRWPMQAVLKEGRTTVVTLW